MKDIKNNFENSILATKSIISVYDYLTNNHFDAIDCSDLLRWTWVQSLSALDRLIHDIALLYMTDLFTTNKPLFGKFKNFEFTAQQCQNLLNLDISDRENEIRKIIANKNSYETFQDPDKICEILSCIWDEKQKFNKISSKMNLQTEYVKTKLKNIVARRNQIVHQNDMPAYNFEKAALTKEQAVGVIDFIQKLGNAILKCIEENITPISSTAS